MAEGSELRFDGQVVVITGGAGALGSAYALDFASRGAKVVVSDVGAAIGGDGRDRRAADKVVDAIQKAGGTAVADYNNVLEGEKIIETAISNFGRIDVLINNAGNLRDKSFRKMSIDDWQAVHKVHLEGAFRCTKAAWDYFQKQKYGRVIMTTSSAGLFGAFGQANYSAAKMGLFGFAQSLAVEGARINVQVNTISPVAGSRLVATVTPQEFFQIMKPEFVSPLVVYLSHKDCEETGSLFFLGAGWFSKMRWQRTEGLTLPRSQPIRAEAIAKSWQKLTDFERNPEYPHVNDSHGPILKTVDDVPMSDVKPQRSKL